MIKTSVYLPDELDIRLEAESAATGISKAELIRRGVSELLERSPRRRQRLAPLPVFHSGRYRTAEEIDEAIREQVAERNARS